MNELSSTLTGKKSQLLLNIYIGIFFIYMFLPLLIMVIAGFNDFDQPSVTVWKGFTLKWFSVLANDGRMWSGLLNSLIIALSVIAIALPFGLAGAFMITRMQSRYTSLLYAIMVSPLLMPGIIIGVSTIIFWGEVNVSGGLFTAIIAQSTFIASYAMLMFMARLQRQDISLEEAAMDLGATPLQVFYRITIPFLKPTILSAIVIAFFQSFENYNTTIFSIGGEHTLVTEIGARMRSGISPAVNVIGILFITITILFSVIYVLYRRQEKQIEMYK